MSMQVLPRWRVRAGTTLFVVGLVLPALIPLLYIVDLGTWVTAALTAGFAIGIPELLWLVAALCIGRDGVRLLWRRSRITARYVWRKVARRLRRQ